MLLEALNPSDTEEEPDAEDPMQIWTDFVARVRNQCADQNLDDKEILNLARVLARDKWDNGTRNFAEGSRTKRESKQTWPV